MWGSLSPSRMSYCLGFVAQCTFVSDLSIKTHECKSGSTPGHGEAVLLK